MRESGREAWFAISRVMILTALIDGLGCVQTDEDPKKVVKIKF